MCETTSVTWHFLQPLLQPFLEVSDPGVNFGSLPLVPLEVVVVVWIQLLHQSIQGGYVRILFEIYYFEKLHAPRSRGACVHARASREGRRDESTVNNSSSKLKNRLTGRMGNLLLFPSMGRGNCESKYLGRSIRGEKL